MTRVILDIKNDEKGKYLLDFLKQIDFLEIKENVPVTGSQGSKESLEEVLLNAPVLSEEEIQNIENVVGKESRNWEIDEF
ncbi:MAG: hypothetical protein GTO45_07500 [Candidatus Aminicenantes bacterium]|nr:hypothetical protein [Candidatus Aminicenantes bacterium]NIM78681.1 hypothetical protein [Candidatus Aminicenantes bacterium]NIN17928.1 hypothetical protein [Candidatus Aminicenantes bacterium]NIN41831.1 hypothetical protein [Candidatus Aminicenantes bacterium]NIN84583.1 hypothetical protein [Candidatus Aminicenantes bacterium]